MYKYPLSQPYLHEDTYSLVYDVIRSGWISSVAPAVSIFEEDLANFLSTKHVFATHSGTAALHLALLSLGIGCGDCVLAPAITFISPINAIKYVGAEPIFIDCDEDLNISPAWLKKFVLEYAEVKGGRLYFNSKLVKGIMLVHVLGNPCDMDFILNFAKDYKLFVIEDATESLGATLNNKSLGTFGDMGALSFNGNKIITTGSGGALITDNDDIYKKAFHLGTQAKADKLYYIHDELGYNYRMCALQAAVGISQLRHLQMHVKKKIELHNLYKNYLRKMRIRKISMLEAKRGISNYWLNAIMIKMPFAKKVRDKLISSLSGYGIETRPIWYPNHLQKPYKNCCYVGSDNSVRVWEQLLCLPSHISLNEQDLFYVVSRLKECL